MNNELIPIVAEILNISKDESGKYPFKVIDSYKNLALAHYDINYIGETNIDSSIRSIRGVIVDIVSKSIVCKSFGYTPTVISDKIPQVGETITDVHNKTMTFPESFRITPITEGTMIRVWKYEDELMISSHRKINCEKSHWGTSGFFRSLFLKYAGDYDLNKLTENGNVAYFILMDKDLTISTKFNLGKRDGAIIYIGSSSDSIVENIPLFSNFNNEEFKDKNMFSINEMTIDEANKHLNQGFYDYPGQPQDSPLCLGEGVIVSYEVDGERKVMSINSPAYYRRCKMVDNDPNVLHRCYKILNQTYYPKIVGAEDNYLTLFPPINVMTDEEITNLTSVIIDGPIPGKLYTEKELIDKNDKASHELRLRNALTWYVMSLALPHQIAAFHCIKKLIEERKQVCEMMCRNFDSYSTGVFEGFEVKHNPDIFKYIQHRLNNAKDYAKLNSKSNNGRNPKASKEAILNNVHLGVMRDSGDWLYNIARVLIRIPKKKTNVVVNEVVEENKTSEINEGVCMNPNIIRFNN
jgi:hypothetical protein